MAFRRNNAPKFHDKTQTF